MAWPVLPISLPREWVSPCSTIRRPCHSLLRSGQVRRLKYSIKAYVHNACDTDVDATTNVPNESNKIWFGATADATIVNRATEEVRTLYPRTGLGDGSEATFTAEFVMSCTWWRVAKYAKTPSVDPLNTFQIVIAWNSQQTYVMYHYARKSYLRPISKRNDLTRHRTSMGVGFGQLRTSRLEALWSRHEWDGQCCWVHVQWYTQHWIHRAVQQRQCHWQVHRACWHGLRLQANCWCGHYASRTSWSCHAWRRTSTVQFTQAIDSRQSI